MTVTPEDKEQMAKLMQIMDGNTTGPARPTSPQPDHNQPIEANMAYSDEDVKEMKTILERFQSVQAGDAGPGRSQARRSKPIDQRWQISENGRGRYSVANQGGDVIARDLLVKESAIALTEMLNRGKSINDMGVVKLLALEQKYRSEVRKVSQASTEKILAEARRNAMTTRNDIRNIAESL